MLDRGTPLGRGRRRGRLTGAAAAVITLLAGCSGARGVPPDAAVRPAHGDRMYVARLIPLNATVTGSAATGEVSFAITGDRLTVATDASGVPPETTHWQHIHGFPDGRDAVCPTDAGDANGDGIVDLIETETLAGTTMVPFNDDPVALDIPRNTYPKASASGMVQYRSTVSLAALEAAFRESFDGQELELERRVVFLHGVAAGTGLPATVASLGPIPAHVTLPIACGEIRRHR